MIETIAFATGIFLMRVLGNAVTTFRLVMLARDREFVVLILGFFESLIFAIAIGAVVANLDSLINLFAYSSGYAVGGSVGIWMERQLTLGYVALTAISKDNGPEIAEALRDKGFGATEVVGHGADGSVLMIETILERHNLQAAIATVQFIERDAFITTLNLQSRQRGYIPAVRPGLARMLNRHGRT
ncbi:MAG: hypothetical protein GYB66_07830 [Chloroflexi bacterium]|nr:hypothetical protein [Chloroflexota bacterium]